MIDQAALHRAHETLGCNDILNGDTAKPISKEELARAIEEYLNQPEQKARAIIRDAFEQIRRLGLKTELGYPGGCLVHVSEPSEEDFVFYPIK